MSVFADLSSRIFALRSLQKKGIKEAIRVFPELEYYLQRALSSGFDIEREIHDLLLLLSSINPGDHGSTRNGRLQELADIDQKTRISEILADTDLARQLNTGHIVRESRLEVDRYLQETGQSFAELMQGASCYGISFITDELIPMALLQKKRIQWKTELKDGHDVGIVKYELI